MATVSIVIPQIGEGLQEARLVGFLKQPGERIKRDEPIYQMETDKAVMDVESPYEGVLKEWLAEIDTILAIGAAVAVIEIDGEATESEAPAPIAEATATSISETSGESSARMTNVPPRTRAYAKEKGLTDDQLSTLAASGKKLMPADIDEFLGSASDAPMDKAYKEAPMPNKQRLLASRLVRATALVVPGTMTVVARWEPIERERGRIKASGSDFQPSAFTMFSYAVTQALKSYPRFRSIMIGDDTLRTYDHVALGIAVGLPDDELVLAVVPDADTLNWKEFAEKSRAQIDIARSGKDQASEEVTVSLTNMQSFGLRDAVPVVVSPAAATIFLGEPYNALSKGSDEMKMERVVNLVMTFDHRLINGVGAAQFLNAIKQNVETISGLLGDTL